MIRSPRSPLLDLRDLLRHDARVAETVDEQRPRLGRQAGVGAVAAPGPEGRDVRVRVRVRVGVGVRVRVRVRRAWPRRT